MTSATLDGFSVDHHLSTDSLLFVDLRLLSQSELYSLSLCSSSSFFSSRCDPDLLIPKIDRSVFNESAGSRKQTFSRLRLVSRNSQEPISHPNHHITTPRQFADPADFENTRIISLLKQLFAVDSSCNADGHGDVDHDLSLVPVEVQFNEFVPGSMDLALHSLPIDVVDGTPRKRKRGRPRKNETVVAVNEVEKGNNQQGNSEPMAMVNDNGDLVDLASVATLDDSLGEELMRRTQGMDTESDLLEYMGRLNGEWVSQRKKRRIVQACNFNAFFPRGWKMMLSLKRKAGHVRLSCRRFISPDGHQFVSCKEVASYLLAFSGLHNISSSIACHPEDIAPFPSKMNARNDVTFNPKKDMDAWRLSSNSQIHISSPCPDHHHDIDPVIERHNDTRYKVNGGMNSVFSCRKEDTAIRSEACTGRDYDSCIILDDKMENAELDMDINFKTNSPFLAKASILNGSNLVDEHLDELNLLRVTSNETDNFVIPDERSGRCSILRSECEQVCNDANKANILPKISMEESVQEFVSQSCSFSMNFQKKHASSVMKNDHVTCSMKDVNISDCKQLDNEKSGYVSTDIMLSGSSRGSQVTQFHDKCEHAYDNKRNGYSAAIFVGSLKVSNTEGGLHDAATCDKTYVVVGELHNSLSTSDEVKEINTNFSLCGSLEKADTEMKEKGSDRNLVFTSSTEHALDFGTPNNVECAEAPKLSKISLKNAEFSTSIKQGSSEACAINACSLYTEGPSYAVRIENDVLHLEEELKKNKVEDCETSILFSSFCSNNGESDSGDVRHNILDLSKDSSNPHDRVGHFGSERDFEASSNCLCGDMKISSGLKNSSWVDAMGTQKQQQADDIIKAPRILCFGKHAHTSIAANCDFSNRKDGQNAVTYAASSHMSLSCSPKSDIMEKKEECDIISVRDFDNVSICYGPRSDSTGIFYSNSLSLQTNPLVEQLENLMCDAETDRDNVSSGYLGFDKQKLDTLKQEKFSGKYL